MLNSDSGVAMIPFVDLKAQYAAIKPEIDSAIQSVLERGQFTLGAEVSEFEQEFAAYCGSAYGVGVNSGASALHAALLAIGAGPGDEVVTVPFTFVATVAAIQYTGAKPVFVDIDPQTFTMDPALIEAAVTPHTKAILPVHLYGQPASMDAILAVAKKYNLAVIEDAAQAHGAEYKGQRAGSLGDIGCFSFYPGKNLGAYGEAGMTVTGNPELARTMRKLRDWGAEKKYHHVIKGFNYRMEAIQGAILRVKLRRLEAWSEARREAARRYDALLRDSGIPTPAAAPDVRHVYHIYAIRTSNREALQRAFLDRGIQSGIHYPTPVHLMPAYSDLGYRLGQFPHSERAAAEVLSLPMYPEIAPAAQETVAAALLEFEASRKPFAMSSLSAA